MFFNINRARHLHGMTLHFVNNGWCVSTDAGWTTFEAFNNGVRTLLIAKGYCDTMSLRDAALHADPRILSGNFCVINITGTRVTVLHDRNRGFPLWHYDEGNTISNLPKPDKISQEIHSDTTISATPDTVEISHFDPYYLEETPPEGDYTTTVNYIADLLAAKAAGLKAWGTAPVKSFVTGGLDSMLAYALTKDHSTLINYDHFERDRFWLKFGAAVRVAYWGYSQIHHWIEPTVLTSGACGDEFFLRGPAAIALWSAYNGALLRPAGYLQPDSYHWEYFSRKKNREVFSDAWDRRNEIRAKYADSAAFKLHLLSMTLNDYQHWHLGNTLTWTPFKDIRILRAILAMPPGDIMEQMVNGDIERDLIARLDPDLLPALNLQKNHREGHNLDKLYR